MPSYWDGPSYVWAPYIPLRFTPPVYNQFQDRNKVLTRYANRVLRKDSLWEATAPVIITDPKMFPHECPRCGSPAYIGFTDVECSRKSCA